MSLGAIVGLLALNLWLLAVGVAVLFAIRGLASWADLLRLGGLAYMLGLSCMGILWTWELTAGLGISFATVFATGFAVAVSAVLVGHRLGRSFPARPSFAALGVPSVTAAVGGGLTVVYLEALFRAGRLAGLYEFDGWSFWVPKAKAIYFFGGLDHQFFRELPNQSYPPIVPALEAAAFHFTGGADVVTLHLQFWFLLAGFVAGLVGILASRVPALFLWPPLLLVLVTPHVVGYALQPQGDFLLDELFALGALLVALWLTERRDWTLVAAALLLAASVLTKREGYLFAALVVLAALLASSRSARALWPKLALMGVAAALMTVPWRILLIVRDLESGAPEAGGGGLFAHADRGWESLRLTLSVLFDFDIWLVVLPVGLLAIAVGILNGARRLPVFASLVYLFGIAGLTWATWAFPTLPVTKEAALNPIVRLTGSLILVTAALVPILLSAGRGANEAVVAR